jgi:DNA-binding CsgD family transcriptional regulator
MNTTGLLPPARRHWPHAGVARLSSPRSANTVAPAAVRPEPANRTPARADDPMLQSADLHVLLEELNLGLVVLAPDLAIRRTRGPVQGWFRHYFRAAVDAPRLPPSLETWVQHQIRAEPPLEPMRCFEADDRQLRVKLSWTRRDGEILLVLRERPRPGAQELLERLGLSAREAEVVSWLVQGKSNPEIARILGIAPRTVHKHLERIYAHLGVENRTAAVVHILDVV